MSRKGSSRVITHCTAKYLKLHASQPVYCYTIYDNVYEACNLFCARKLCARVMCKIQCGPTLERHDGDTAYGFLTTLVGTKYTWFSNATSVSKNDSSVFWR